MLGSLKKAFELGRAVDARREAHNLKSNGRTFGAMNLGKLCQQVEDACKNNHLDEAASHLPELEGELARVLEELRHLGV